MPINYEAAKTLIKGLVQKMKSFRGNWEQNDPTADDYIKNRPFYTEQAEIVILPETTINGEQSVNIKTPLIVGQEYKITWNGVVYKSIAREYDGYRMIGNNAVYEFDSGIENNTGEPFAAETNGDKLDLFFYMDDTVTEPPTVSITIFGESVHKIDNKYLPDMNFVSYKKNQNLTYDQQETALWNIGDALYDGVYDIVNGQKLVKYTSQSLNASQQATARNNIGAASSSDISNATSDVLRYSEQTLTDEQKEVARTNIGAGTSNFDGYFFNLNNKPIYNYPTSHEDTPTYSWNKDTSVTNFSIPIKFNSKTTSCSYYKISEDTPEYTHFIGCKIAEHEYSGDNVNIGHSYELGDTIIRNENDDSYFVSCLFSQQPGKFFVARVAGDYVYTIDGQTFSISVPEPGIYACKEFFSWASTARYSYTTEIYLATDFTAKTTSNSLILTSKIGAISNPLVVGVDTIGDYKYALTVSDLEANAVCSTIMSPSTAQVGQTIVVKAVNDTGTPTEWEAVDMNVLTSPSGKNFKITIDDDGVLTATEIVESTT